jgi:YVTN family beta-propeller protein
MHLPPDLELVVSTIRRIAMCAAVGSLLLVTANGASAAASEGDVVTSRISGKPLAGTYARGKLWVLQLRGGQTELIEIAPATGRATGRSVTIESPAGEYPELISPSQPGPSLATSGGRIWAIDHVTNTVVMVDPATATVIRRVDIGGTPGFLAFGAAGLWITDDLPRAMPDGSVGFLWRLARIRPTTGTVDGEVLLGPGLGGVGPVGLAVGQSRLFTAWPSPSRLRRNLDIGTRQLRFARSDGWQMVARRGALLTAERNSCAVRIEGAIGRTSSRRTGGPVRVLAMRRPELCYPRAVAIGPGQNVWAGYFLGRTAPGLLVERSLSRDHVRTYKVGRDLVGVVSGGGPYVWALSRSDQLLTRVRSTF